MVARWLVARWCLGGELVGGETPWWRDDRIPSNQRQEQDAKMVRYTQQKHFFYIKKLFNLKLNYSMKVSIHYIIQGF